MYVLDAAARIGGYVADGEHSMWQGWSTNADRKPGCVGRSQKVLGIGDCEKLRRVHGPVNSVDYDRGVGCDLRAKGRDVTLRVLVVLLRVEATVFFALQVMTTAYLARIYFVRV